MMSSVFRPKIPKSIDNSFFIIHRILILVLAVFVSGCGGSTSSSGADANNSVSSDLVGVYSGTETINLAPSEDPESVQTDEREATITVQQNGQITVRSVSSQNSTSGNGRLRNNNTFTLIADARTQFDGACESGTLYLDGMVTENSVTGEYRSENLVCGSVSYSFTGIVMASR